MRDRVRRCIFCLHDVRQTVRGDVVTAACDACGAIFQVVFNPPGSPWLRGEIDVIVEPHVDVEPQASDDPAPNAAADKGDGHALDFECVELLTEEKGEK